jgi:CDP-diacylglycerol--glycerol-3-phosphate 3-phosphatidyltransferase
MNLPTKLTVTRIVLIPVFILLWYLPNLGEMAFLSVKSLSLSAFFVVLAGTDWLDGYLARKYNLITDLGKFLDPIADKILVFSIYLLLLNVHVLEPISLIILLSREFIVATVRMDAATKNYVIAADRGGKIKTVLQMVSILLFLLCAETISMPMHDVTYGIYYLSVLAAISSGISYVTQYVKKLEEVK